MWKAAFTGRSETGSVSGRSSSGKKKSAHSSSSRRSEDEKRKSEKPGRSSTYGDDESRATYVTAPSSRVGEPRALTESAVGLLNQDDDGWEDDDKDARSERKSVRSDGRKHRRRSEKERSRSRSRDTGSKRKSGSRRESEIWRGKSRPVDHSDGGDDRAIPEMGSFEQFPGQYAGGMMGSGGAQEPMMSGALPSSADNQFGPSRADSYGHASEYYLDEGQSVTYQPGVRAKSPNMLVNPDLDHLMMASAQAQPAQDTGHGSAADFYGGKGSPVLTAEPQPITSSKPYSSRSSKPSKPGRHSSLGTAAAATATAGMAMGAAATGNSYYQSQNQTSSTPYQSGSGRPSGREPKPNRHNSGSVPSGSNGSYYGPPPPQSSSTPGKQSSHSNAGLYTAGAAAAGAAGLAAYDMDQRHQQNQHTPSVSPYGGTQFARPPSYGPPQTPQMNGISRGIPDQHFHEHKGPLSRLKDGLFNLISSEEDTIKMEMYTEHIGVCKYCFDPRTSPYDAPRQHHFHKSSSRDSFEELRRRRSLDRMRRRSREQLGRTGSSRVDKDNRYYPSDRRESSSKTNLVAAGLGAVGVAAGANALFNSDARNFDDTYSIKSGHRESSAVRRRSRSSSREKRRRSSHGVVGRDTQEEYVTARTKDGRMERRKVHRSRSGSRDRKSSVMGAATGAALGASAVATGRSRHSRDHTPNGTFVRRRSGSRSSSGSNDGIFGGFFSPPSRKRKGSRTQREKKQRGFFSFGNDSASSSSDSELAFGASRTDLPLRRKTSMRSTTKRKKSDEHLAATVAGIGATAAALAAAQKGQRISKRSSRPQLGARRDVKISRPYGEPASRDDEWEDEVPSDVDDASSGSDLAFGDYDKKLSHRQSRESIGSQSSGAGGLGAWGWRWGGKDKKKRRRPSSPRQVYPPRPGDSIFGSAAAGMAAGAGAGAAFDAAGRPVRPESTITSSSSIPQRDMQYVDPRPLSSDAGSLPGSRHASMPGAFDASPPVIRPGPAPLQQPKPVTPIQPAFTQTSPDMDYGRPKPTRTQSSPTQSSFAKDAALIGAAAVGTAAVIASQGRRSKDVRFGLTEEQERKHEQERRKQQQRADEERRRADRARALKEEAERHTREQDVLRARELENRRAAEAELQRQQSAQREAEEQAEIYRQRESERLDREEAYRREQALTVEIERKKRDLEDQQRRDLDRGTGGRREYEAKAEEFPESSSIPWSAVGAGAAAAAVGAVALAGHERNQEGEEESRGRVLAREIKPSEATSGAPLMDDDILDRDYFKRSRSHDYKSPDYAQHVDRLARKAAGKVTSARNVLADNDAYYKEPQQSQADFFAPEEILHQPSEGKTKVADPIDDNNVHVFNAADIKAREEFEELYGGPSKVRNEYAPRGVPKLNLISPTPPPSAMKRSSTPKAQDRDTEAQGEERPRKSSRSRSISWGADQTHVYDVPTPDSHQERDSYIESRDVPTSTSRGTAAAATAAGIAATAVAGGALHEVVVEPASRNERTGEIRDDEDVEDSRGPTPVYQQPFFDSVSDIGFDPFKVETPGTEGAPPVRGFVEGEVEEPTPMEERAPHIPGGFDDGYETFPAPASDPMAREIPSSRTVSESAAEPVPYETARDVAPEESTTELWVPPLSKKERKKREKAAKRSETLDSDPILPSAAAPEDTPLEAVPEPPNEPETLLSKKDRKKRDKALKRGMSEEQVPSAPNATFADITEEPSQARAMEQEPEPAWEPPLSKKEKKKREKEAKKSGFADVAETVMTAGGIAAVAGSMDDSTGESSSSKRGKKGKKSKGTSGLQGDIRDIEHSPEVSTEPTERDIRDMEPSRADYTEPTDLEPTGMPGSWDADSRDKEAALPSEVVDPFQYQVHDDPPPVPSLVADPDPALPENRTLSNTMRDGVRFNEPATSSPLRSEVPFADYVGKRTAPVDEHAPTTNGYDILSDQFGNAGVYSSTTAGTDPVDVDQTARPSGYEAGNARLTDSPRISPDDLRSVASDPTGDRDGRRSKGEKSRRDRDYYEEPETYDDARSVAASEPADVYESSRKSKRRSRHEEDDSASVVSSKLKREKAEAQPISKDKKGGFFGLFGRKSSDSVAKSTTAPLSRQSTKDSKDNELGDDGERSSHRRRKHRDSEYGDDDDSRSVASEAKSKRYSDDDYERREGENGHRHHHRRRTDEGEYSLSRQDSESGHRHHHRRRTEDELYDKEQSFLGMRVEGMPPLPADREVSLGPAPVKPEQGLGNLVSTEPDTSLVSRDHADAFDAMLPHERDEQSQAELDEPDAHVLSRDHADAFDAMHPLERDEQPRVDLEVSDSRDVQVQDQQAALDEQNEYLPALPDSRAGSPTAPFDANMSQRPSIVDRHTSTTAVPLRLPGYQPLTPTHRMERAISFGGSLPTSPATPVSAQKMRQGRPASTEIRPLYLVERNRKTPEVEEGLPSLPSSKPSSRASSMIGSDEYESAAENMGSPEQQWRNLTISTSPTDVDRPEDDYLDSQQTTPRATEFPRDVFDMPPRQKPQFYTWEDFAREERMRSTSTGVYETSESAPVEYFSPAADVQETAHLRDSAADPSRDEHFPELPLSRPESPTERDSSLSATAGVAAAAAIGGAAVLGYHALSQDRQRQEDDELGHDTGRETVPSPYNLISEPVSGSIRDGTRETDIGETRAPFLTFTALEPSRSRDVEGFVTSERQMEEGTTAGPLDKVGIAPAPEANELDRFLGVEEQMEAGEVGAEPPTDVPMDIDQARSTSPPELAGDRTESTDYPDAPVPVVDVQPPSDLPAQATEATPIFEESASATESLSRETPLTTETHIVQPRAGSVPSDIGDVDQFMESEEQMEAGQASIAEMGGYFTASKNIEPFDDPSLTPVSMLRDDAVYPAPEQLSESIGAEPLDVKPIPADVDNSQAASAPVLTRKQSKKAKKREKAASKQRSEAVASDSAMPTESTDEYAVEDAPESTPSAQQDMDTEMASTTRTLSAGAATSDASGLSEATRRRSSNKHDSGLKSSASAAATSVTTASMQTLMDHGESSAARSLTALGSEEPKESESDARDLDRSDNMDDVDTQSPVLPPERPILRPERSEPWETFPTTSRKRSKKEKKQREQQQLLEEVEGAPSREILLEIVQDTEALEPTRETAGADENAELIEPVTTAVVKESNGIVQPSKPSDHYDTVIPEDVPLPQFDDDEFECEVDADQNVLQHPEDQDQVDFTSNQVPDRTPAVSSIIPVASLPSFQSAAEARSIVHNASDSRAADPMDLDLPSQPPLSDVLPNAQDGAIEAPRTDGTSEDVLPAPELVEPEKMDVDLDSGNGQRSATAEDETNSMTGEDSIIDKHLVRDSALAAHAKIAAALHAFSGDSKSEDFTRAGHASAIHSPKTAENIASVGSRDLGEEPIAVGPSTVSENAPAEPSSLAPDGIFESEKMEIVPEAPNKETADVAMPDVLLAPSSAILQDGDQADLDNRSTGLELLDETHTHDVQEIGQDRGMDGGDEPTLTTAEAGSADRELAPNQEPDEEFAWTTSSKKKGKKGKKGKKSAPVTPPVWEEPESVRQAVDDSLDQQLESETVLVETKTPATDEQTGDADHPETLWEPLSSKKKKGKKGRKSAAATPPVWEEPESVPQSDHDTLNQQLQSEAVPMESQAPAANEQTRDVQDPETLWEPLSSKKKKGKNGKKYTAIAQPSWDEPEQTVSQGSVFDPQDEPVRVEALDSKQELSTTDETIPDADSDRQEPTISELPVAVDAMPEEPVIQEPAVQETSREEPAVDVSVADATAGEELHLEESTRREPTREEPPFVEDAPRAAETSMDVRTAATDLTFVDDKEVPHVEPFERSDVQDITIAAPQESDTPIETNERTFHQQPESSIFIGDNTISDELPSMDVSHDREPERVVDADPLAVLESSQSYPSATINEDPATGQSSEPPAPDIPDTATTENVESFWEPFPSKKKGKKGKKALDETEPRAGGAGDEVVELQRPQSELVDQSTAATSTEMEDESKQTTDAEAVDFWTAPVKGKKSKKSAFVATEFAEMPQEESGDPQESREALEAQNRSVESPSGVFPGTSDLPKDPMDVDTVDFLAVPATGKKAKKGKKNKRMAAEAEDKGVAEEAKTTTVEPAPSTDLDMTTEESYDAPREQATLDPLVTSAVSERDMQDRRLNEIADEAIVEVLPPLPESPPGSPWLDGANPLNASSQPAPDDRRTELPEAALEPSQPQSPKGALAVSIINEATLSDETRTVQPDIEYQRPAAYENEEPRQRSLESMDLDKNIVESMESDVPLLEKSTDTITGARTAESTEVDPWTNGALAGREDGTGRFDETIPPAPETAEPTLVVSEQAASAEHASYWSRPGAGFDEQRTLAGAMNFADYAAESSRALPDTQDPQVDVMEYATSVPLPESTAEEFPEEIMPESNEHLGAPIFDQETGKPVEDVMHVESSARELPAVESHDDQDFTVDVATGLADSGFDPEMVMNNPAFQRRTSPPGGVAEADPEEIFTAISSKKKKGKKGKRISETSKAVKNGPIPEPERYSQERPTDDFNETLEKTLVGTGFNTALLHQVASSSNDVSSNEITRDAMEYSFTTSKRNKGKKGKKTQALTAAEVPSDTPQENAPVAADTGENLEPDEVDASRQIDSSGDVSQMDQETFTQQPMRISTPALVDDQDAGAAETLTATAPRGDVSSAPELLPEEVEDYSRAPESGLSREVDIEDPAAHLAIAGDREMDVDDMDRAYQAFKKNKKNKKKQKGVASQAASLAETPLEAKLEDKELKLPEPQPPERTLDVPQQEILQAVHQGHESKHESREVDTRSDIEEPRRISQSLGSAASEGFLHTPEASQSLPVAVGRSPSPLQSILPHNADTSVERQLTQMGTELGSEEAGNVPNTDRSSRELPAENNDYTSGQPSWSFANLVDEDQPLPESPLPGNKAHEIARDSGYQTLNSPSLQRDSIDSTSRKIPEIHTSQSRESLSSRRSAEPLRISTETGSDWALRVAKSRDGESVEGRTETLHARTPSQKTDDTPLESTTKNRASYLFQSTPETLKEWSVTSDTPTPSRGGETSNYFPTGSRDLPLSAPEGADERSFNTFERTAFSPPPTGAMSPRGPLDTIPEEHHAQKRTVAETDATNPENSKAIRRTQTPQAIRAREREFSPLSLPPVTIPAGSGRSISNPLSTDEIIDRMAWPSVEEDNGTVGRSLKRKSSRQASVDKRSPSVMSNLSNKSGGQYRSPDELRSYSRTSNRSSTPTLRRISLSGDLRAASKWGEAGSAVGARSSPKTIPFEPPPTPPSNDDEVMDAGASRSVNMSDVYVSLLVNAQDLQRTDHFPQQGYGDAQASQVSPTRPPNMRKRQSMHIMELESRLDQLSAENQALQDARQNRGISPNQQDVDMDTLNARDLQLREKDNEINQIRTMLQPMQEEIARLNEINNGLTEANRNLVDDTNGRYATLQQEHAQAHDHLQNTSRELEDMRQEHGRLTEGMREIVEAEIATKVADKDSEIRQLREELDVASEKIRALQVQLQSSRGRDFLTTRDEDYFDGACQKLCQHVQQWVLRFSKMSDNRVCRLSTDLKDDKIEARLDNAILDGSDVDKLLGDRIRRRDVFMSVVMTMVWEYVFTRYLFGMDREQRQKLKSLEKVLAEVGPPRAVAQWRATTLTLLAKRPAFAEQRDLDTEAVANEAFGLLCSLLPPPSNAEQQLLSSLQKVIGIAVDLSIEMRTQRAEYIMLPPLQPEYDTNGDLVRKVHFNASLMNERSGMFSSNEELEESRAVVKIVLFPLVVKKGDEVGEGEEEIVVCPAQVLVHNDNNRGKKIVRVQSGAMEIDSPRRSRQSLLSAQGSTTAFLSSILHYGLIGNEEQGDWKGMHK